jgi:hypothetical protein
MTGIVADVNLIGTLRILIQIIERSELAELWTKLELRVAEFEELGLPRESADRVVWSRCQELGLVLITGNRNDDGPDSLEATIADSNGPSRLPVLTVSSTQKVLKDRQYTERVAIDMLEHLGSLRDSPELLMGAGRLFLPIRAANP